MSNNINKMKGATNVKEIGGEEIFSSKDAAVIRDESEWNAFQLVGDSNREEMEHVAEPKRGTSEKEIQKALDRGLAFRMGRKIQMMLDAEAA